MKSLFYRTTGHYKIAGLLIKNGANINAVDRRNWETPLHLATHYSPDDDYYAVVEQLIYAGANVNIVSAHNETPLDIARDDRSKFIDHN